MNTILVRFLAGLFCLALVTTVQAVPVVYQAVLSGPAESPPNSSPGTGVVTVIIDVAAHTLTIQSSFTGLTGPTTAAHIHAPTTVAGAGTAAVATQTPSFIGFPLGVTAGTFANTYDTSLAGTYRAEFITLSGGTPLLAETALAAALAEGKAYFNVHTSAFPGGEIRGFLTPVPDTGSTIFLFGATLAGLMAHRRRLARRKGGAFDRSGSKS